jgi:outer membrane autotransporter protein
MMKSNFVSLMGRLAGMAFLATMVWTGTAWAWGTEHYIYDGVYGIWNGTGFTPLASPPNVEINQNETFTGKDEVGFDNGVQATLKSGFILSVPDGKGELWVENGSTLFMEGTSAISTKTMMGVADGGDSPGKEAHLVLLGDATITSQVVFFGSMGTVDVGVNTLHINGANNKTYFLGSAQAEWWLDIPGEGLTDLGPITGQDSKGVYQLTVNDAISGKIAVDGDVIIGKGAKVYITNAATNGKINAGVNDEIMTATGSYTTENPADNVFLNSSFYVKESNKSLIISQKTGTPMELAAAASGAGLTSNYAKAGALIDRIVLDAPTIGDRLLANLQLIDNEAALKQFIGEGALPNLNAHHDTVSMMASALGGRFQALHGGLPPAAGNGPNANRLWLGPFGQWNRQKDDSDVYGYDYNAGGIMLGYDREITDSLTLGLYGSLADGRLKSDLADTDIKTVGLGLYGLYEFGDGFFVDASFGYGHSDNDSTINMVLGGRKTSDFTSDSLQAGLNFGKAFRLGEAATLTPSAGLRYTHVKQNGWEEKIASDPDNIAVANWFGNNKQNFLEIPLNLKLATTFETSGGAVIAPELRLGGIIAANNPDSEIRMGFVGSGDSAVISGIDPGKSRFVTGAGVKAQLTEAVDLFANYDLEFRSGYQGHSASAGLGISF